MFLSDLMNRSGTWSVMHEQTLGKLVTECTSEIQRTLNRDYYGEVNGAYRLILEQLNVGRKGFILRHPANICISVMNRRPMKLWEYTFRRIEQTLAMVPRYDELGYEMIRFGEMVTDPTYAQKLLRKFGITDVEVTADILQKKVNPSKTDKYKRIEDIPGSFRNRVIRLAEPIANKYGLEIN